MDRPAETQLSMIPEVQATIKSSLCSDGFLLMGRASFLAMGVCEYLVDEGCLEHHVEVRDHNELYQARAYYFTDAGREALASILWDIAAAQGEGRTI